MAPRSLLSMTCLAILLPAFLSGCSSADGTTADDSDWTLAGVWTDSCSCKVTCPCLFGSGPTEGYCEGASLLEIESGRAGGIRLDGTAVVATYRVGKWARISVGDNASPEQVEALAALVPRVMPFLAKGSIDEVEVVPLTVERSGEAVRFSVPETSVALELVRGANGEPIKLQNLPVPGTPFPPFHDHTQYRSIHLRHRSEGREFSHSGRNGFVSRVELAGGDSSGA